LSGLPPIEPWKPASPNANTPPSSCQYPPSSGVRAMPRMFVTLMPKPGSEPWNRAVP
jgi:hypothetical protein